MKGLLKCLHECVLTLNMKKIKGGSPLDRFSLLFLGIWEEVGEVEAMLV